MGGRGAKFNPSRQVKQKQKKEADEMIIIFLIFEVFMCYTFANRSLLFLIKSIMMNV